MKSVNKLILVGHAGKDADMSYTPAGLARTKFSLATNDGKTKDGQPITSWHNIILWDKKAELAGQYVRKGRLLYVEGRISYREYTDKNGQTQKITEVIASDFTMLDKDSSKGELVGVGAGHSDVLEEDISPDDIPF